MTTLRQISAKTDDVFGDGNGTQLNRAVCVDCSWENEDARGELVRSSAEAHRAAAGHSVELRVDVLGILLETLEHPWERRA